MKTNYILLFGHVLKQNVTYLFMHVNFFMLLYELRILHGCKGAEDMAKMSGEIILANSYPLFMEQGYEKTSMRQIAKACDITVGNISYYFAKKEDLFMAFYSEIVASSRKVLAERFNDGLSPWCSYIAKETCILETFYLDIRYRRLYLEATNIEALREMYITYHKERFLDAFEAEDFGCDDHTVKMMSAIVSAVECQIINSFAAEIDEETFKDFAMRIFFVQTDFLGLARESVRPDLEEGIKIARAYIHKEFLTFPSEN